MTNHSNALTRRVFLSSVGATTGLAAVGGRLDAKVGAWQRAADLSSAIRPPHFPNRTVDVLAMGARADGQSLSTQAFDRAIRACSERGGGQVLVPPGHYRSGAIRLRSGVNLHLAAGATITFSSDPADYPMVRTRWEGVELINYSPLVFADGETDVAITGQGTLDGAGAAWWPWSGSPLFGWHSGLPNQSPSRSILFAMAERGVPVDQRIFGAGHGLRPMLVQFQRCANILVEGVTLRDSPFWTIHPVLCRNVTIRRVSVIGHGPNTDGCDPESVDGMIIEHCSFDTGDDCIAIKSGRNADGRRLGTPARNILIRDCTMRDGHGGVVIGSEVSGGVDGVFVERCHMDSPNLWYALRFKNNALRGGRVEHIHCRDIHVGQVAKAAIGCDFTYEEGANGPFPPILRDVSIARMKAASATRVLDLQGLPDAPIDNIRLADCRFDGVTAPSIVSHVRELALHRISVNGHRVASL